MARDSVHTIRHVTNDPLFIQCRDGLTDEDGTQIATITSIDDVELELLTAGSDPETWSTAVTKLEGFSSIQILNDPTSPSGFSADMVAALLSISGASPQPSADATYRIVAHCTITFIAGYGSGTAKRDFVRPARIAASVETAPA